MYTHQFPRCNMVQWRIQDFPDGGGGANPKGEGVNLLPGKNFPNTT